MRIKYIFVCPESDWKVLKNRLAKEGSQSVTNCNRLKVKRSIRLKVRPVKLASLDEYREHYRGRLSQMADKFAGPLLDCRAAARLRLSALWRENPRILEQQLEFLRHTLESETFRRCGR